MQWLKQNVLVFFVCFFSVGKLHSAYGEIQTFQQMATVLEASSKEELASQQRRHHEEMNSLQHMLQGQP